MQPQIVIPQNEGRHNLDANALARLSTAKTYQDLSTVMICPTRGQIPAKVVQSWMGLMRPMNQKVIGPIFLIGMEVGDAYNQGVQMILSNPELAKYKYILTIEEDNMPPPDGLLKLYEQMDRYDAIGGLYWTKGETGQPMIYGHPRSIPLNFIPQMPQTDTVQECNGLGMGFTLFSTKIFKDKMVPKPWFQTIQEYTPGKGGRGYTQDLYFFENIHRLGYKVACDTRVRVGHYDYENDIVW